MFSCNHSNEVKQKFEIKKSVLFDLEEIKKRGKLILLAENSTVSYFIYKGEKMGYEYEIIREYAKYLGVNLEVKMLQNLDEIEKKLNSGYGDIVACNLNITPQRKQQFNFTVPHSQSSHVLIQKKPKNWRDLNEYQVDSLLVRTKKQLIEKKIHVWEKSSYYKNIKKISDNLLKGKINIIKKNGETESEEYIRLVSEDSIKYTITDENLAKIALKFYPNIDLKMEITSKIPLAFAVRKNSNKLLKHLNTFLSKNKDKSTLKHIYRKYFKHQSNSRKAYTKYSSIVGDEISPYDKIIKRQSKKLGWHWSILASLIYKESKFKNNKVSWAGAFGIMQFMPNTGKQYGVFPNSPIKLQIQGGVKKLNKNYNQWLKKINDSIEAINFTLATYNAGIAHVEDARRLAEKYSLNKNKWFGNVEKMILKLMKPKFYKDKVVKYGYCRGVETKEYVEKILNRAQEYKSVYD